ncbi:TRAP transporter large permease [Pseudooceanicola sediminis]|uniref:TRAP transporter large permease protein n=1 Tax=Pseudooceanicola sediminis TaxID=2211117 RepID=A0A399J321_9RHOB|nr:TRAP transporter large permease [Pseudooceanicola sediminis]KAA2314974.1 TRAP transporter large permease [Puniceibacterium sp. HSS470]RII37346.1 TRAP transporter large permease [Pseudooceanicola sediminis]|tara:strand:- start:5006 stop:6322 length:1317 start_codon:yes stop_codon:yes gene_type:complete
MSGVEIAFGSIALMLVLIYGGLHVAIALILTSFLGVWILRDNFDLAANMLVVAFKDSITDQLFGVVPLFVLMGLVVSISGMGRDTFDVAQQAFRRIRGGLGVATVAANAVFAAITGISIASAAVFTKVAVPEMRRHGYTRPFSVGVVAGSSVLGMLIPPSLLFILYGILTEQSVGSLFIAGVLPGLLLAATYAAGIIAMAYLLPGFVGGTTRHDDPPAPRMGWPEIAAKLLPIAALVALVMGGIYGGIFTPTEAGGAGAAGAIVVALIKRRLGWREFWQVLVQTGHTTASICFLIIGASLYSRMLAFTGMPGWLGQSVLNAGFSANGVVISMIVVMVLLGTILDSSSILLLVLPIAVPILNGLGVDLIWLGVIAILSVEIGLLTPPFGIAVYVIKATLGPEGDITLGQIFAGAAPFALMMLLVLGLVFFFPAIATALL